MGIQRLLMAFLRGVCAVVYLGMMATAVYGQDAPPPPPPAPADPNVGAADQPDPNVQVMTRGPVHEAFAVPVTAGQTAGMIVPKQPAAPIEEVPPDMKPEGDQTVWIPGYWSWDDDRKDFIWVSGVWRVPPPNYRWMPGYWQEAPGKGYQWISGYWMPAKVDETTFMPQPPQTIEAGPTSNPPDANQFWVPGNWQWRETRYLWQPGYWTECRPDWIWVPATYYWCPRGWVYVPGYWDYPLARRGLVFSPVYFTGPVAVYRPAVCLDVGVFGFSLFCRPAYCHYYFGDYYDDHYVALGIRPWFHYSSPRFGYDPLYSYYHWYHVQHLGERQWDHNLRGWHDYYRVHPEMRPPHTLTAQRELLASRAALSRPDIKQLHMAHDVHQLSKRPEAFVKLQPVSQSQRVQLQQAAVQTNRFEAERRQFEKKPIGTASVGPTHPERVNLTNIPSFKSTQLPGAAAANVNSTVTRPKEAMNVTGAGVHAAGAVNAGSTVGRTTGTMNVTGAGANAAGAGSAGSTVGRTTGTITVTGAGSGTTSTKTGNPTVTRPAGSVFVPGAGTSGAGTGSASGRPTFNPGKVSTGSAGTGAGSSGGTGHTNPSTFVPGKSNPSGGNPPAGSSGRGSSGSGGRDPRDREKKVQTSVTPKITADTAPHALPARNLERRTPTNPVRSGDLPSRSHSDNQARTAVKVDSGKTVTLPARNDVRGSDKQDHKRDKK
jgi:hypothetical protein